MSNALSKITTRAKQIRKKTGKSWKASVKAASTEYRAGKLGTVGKVAKKKPAAKSRKKAAKKKAPYRQTGSSAKYYDQMRQALPPGARIPKGGKKVTYYERRKNRSDVPGKLTGTAYNEMVLRNLATENRNLQESESRLIRLQAEVKRLPKGMAKRLMQRNVADQKKHMKAIKNNIRMLKVLLK